MFVFPCCVLGGDGRRSTLLASGTQTGSQRRHQVVGSAAEEPQVMTHLRCFTFHRSRSHMSTRSCFCPSPAVAERCSTWCFRTSPPCPSRGRWVCWQVGGGRRETVKSRRRHGDVAFQLTQGMFEPYMKSFYVRSTDPTHIKTLKVGALLNCIL